MLPPRLPWHDAANYKVVQRLTGTSARCDAAPGSPSVDSAVFAEYPRLLADHTLTNLQWLCTGHHLAKTKRESAAARWRHRASRPVERHPGLT